LKKLSSRKHERQQQHKNVGCCILQNMRKAKYEAEVQENAKVVVAANPKQQETLFGEGK
jgi:hypothetical protein